MTADDSFTNTSQLLVLMRHAKSDHGDPELSDHQRPLNRRGRQDAPQMANWLEQIGATPDVILCSSSARTQETASLMAPNWTAPPTVLSTDSLYLATPTDILRTIRSDGCDARVLLVIGHNPGMADLVAELDGEAVHMPTAAAAVFIVTDHSLQGDWGGLRGGDQLQLQRLMTPKAL